MEKQFTIEQWQHLLNQREARLKELRKLKAPDKIIQKEVELVMEAKRGVESYS